MFNTTNDPDKHYFNKARLAKQHRRHLATNEKSSVFAKPSQNA